MSEQERNALLEDLEILKELLDIHLQNPDFWKDDQKGFEEYVNAVLDRMNEIRKKLNEPRQP